MQYFLAMMDPKASTSDYPFQKLKFYQPDKVLPLNACKGIHYFSLQ